MRLQSGIKLLQEREGNGPAAKKGGRVVYNLRIYLNKGGEVLLNERQAELLPEETSEQRLIDHAITLGRRQAIAGVEYSLIGMKPGGYRRVRVSPHLAYRDRGLTGLIPADAVLLVELWLREVIPA